MFKKVMIILGVVGLLGGCVGGSWENPDGDQAKFKLDDWTCTQAMKPDLMNPLVSAGDYKDCMDAHGEVFVPKANS